MFRNRTHAVTFRLEETEYEELTKTALSQGARSISDFARAAVMGRVSARVADGAATRELETLTARLDAFDLILKDLRSHVMKVLGVEHKY